MLCAGEKNLDIVCAGDGAGTFGGCTEEAGGGLHLLREGRGGKSRNLSKNCVFPDLSVSDTAMSKKKAFSRSTMTLRDFHGGSIPSDLPLPSAPGMVVERKNHDRPGSGGWMGSSLHRTYTGERVGFARQGSGTFARSYEEKVSYLPNPANIGRNYDEDERKPVEGHNYRGQVAELFEEQSYERQVGNDRPPERYTLDNKLSFTPSKYSDLRADMHAQEDLSPNPTALSFRTESFSRRPAMYQQDSQVQTSAAQDHIGRYPPQSMITGHPQSPYQSQEPGQPWRQNSLGHQPVTPGTAMGSGSGVQNVWTARREGEYGRAHPPEYAISDGAVDGRGLTVGTRIAQASALEKISSGRWNSRTLQSPIDSPQMYTGEYVQPYGGSYEGGSIYASHNNARPSADAERAVYADSFQNDLKRGAYTDAGRGMDIRDHRLDVEKASSFDSKREQFMDGRGLSQPEPNQHADDRAVYSETGWRGSSVHRESARFGSTKEGVLESGYMKGTKDTARFGVNEAAADPYVEARGTMQSNPGWIRLDPSPRRDFGDGMVKDGNKGLSLDLERRGFTSRDMAADKEYGSAQRFLGHEGQRERGLHLDSLYHATVKENSGHLTSPYLKGREDFSHEVSDSARIGRSNDRNRALLNAEVDLGHVGHLQSPGSVRTIDNESGGTDFTLPVEAEGKGIPMERPKLKLLPRTKPLEVDHIDEPAQEGLEEVFEINRSTVLSCSEGDGGSGSVVAVVTGSEEHIQAVERPKLSLKPRSQAVYVVPADNGSVKRRMSVFGGARPRELVLKERGIDDFTTAGADATPTPSSVPSAGGSRTPIENNRSNSGGLSQILDKHEKLEEKSRRADQPDAIRHIGRQDSGRVERMESRGRREQMERDERRGSEYRHLQEKRESERPDVDKQDNWRRPVEVYSNPQTPMPSEQSSGGAGRAIQSAAELAQSFSRSASFGAGYGASATQGYASQRSHMPPSPGPGFGTRLDSPGLRNATPSDVPFSRLTEAVSPGPRDYHASGYQSGYNRTSAF